MGVKLWLMFSDSVHPDSLIVKLLRDEFERYGSIRFSKARANAEWATEDMLEPAYELRAPPHEDTGAPISGMYVGGGVLNHTYHLEDQASYVRPVCVREIWKCR